jgi:DNA-binding MarR family transcriptional regulator
LNEENQSKIKKLEILLRSACFNIKQKGREILQDFDITPPQFNALQFLIQDGEMTVSELSSKLYLAPSTITDLIDRMEKNKLVTRVRDTQDRRTVKIKVEDKGDVLINEVIIRRCEYLNALLQDMPEDDKEQFIKYLEVLVDGVC